MTGLTMLGRTRRWSLRRLGTHRPRSSLLPAATPWACAQPGRGQEGGRGAPLRGPGFVRVATSVTVRLPLGFEIRRREARRAATAAVTLPGGGGGGRCTTGAGLEGLSPPKK